MDRPLLMVHWSAAFLVLVPSNLDRPRQKKQFAHLPVLYRFVSFLVGSILIFVISSNLLGAKTNHVFHRAFKPGPRPDLWNRWALRPALASCRVWFCCWPTQLIFGETNAGWHISIPICWDTILISILQLFDPSEM